MAADRRQAAAGWCSSAWLTLGAAARPARPACLQDRRSPLHQWNVKLVKKLPWLHMVSEHWGASTALAERGAAGLRARAAAAVRVARALPACLTPRCCRACARTLAHHSLQDPKQPPMLSVLSDRSTIFEGALCQGGGSTAGSRAGERLPPGIIWSKQKAGRHAPAAGAPCNPAAAHGLPPLLPAHCCAHHPTRIACNPRQR